MKIVILSISFLLCCLVVAGSPAPQFGYQQSNNPVGQLVSQGILGLQNSLQSVSNALQGIPRPSIPNPFRPETQLPNQIPGGPGPIQTGPIPNGPFGNGNGPIPNGPYGNGNGPYGNGPLLNGPYGNGPIPNGPYGNGPFVPPNRPIPYEQQVFQVQPNAPWPYRQIESDEQQYNPTSWIPLPLFSQLSEPFIIIISRPSRHPLSQPGTKPNVTSSDSSQTTKPSQNITPTMTTTPGKK